MHGAGEKIFWDVRVLHVDEKGRPAAVPLAIPISQLPGLFPLPPVLHVVAMPLFV